MKSKKFHRAQTNPRNQMTLMKTSFITRLAVSTLISIASQTKADPLIDCWLTTYSGEYARLYLTDADKSSGNAVSTWSRNSISQTIPAYCGIYFVGYSGSWVYIRSSGLASHIMGPWYLNAAHTQLFPNVPKNTATLYRIPRRSEEHTSNSSHLGISYAVFCLKKI